MPFKLPAVSEKLDDLRRKAQVLDKAGFRKEAKELMRISRGEVRIESGDKLFDLSAAEISAAKRCTLQQRLIIAANQVASSQYGSTEDEYSDATDSNVLGRPKWPKGSKKISNLHEIANQHNLSPTSLKKFMQKGGWKIDNLVHPFTFQFPDWDPDIQDEIFVKKNKGDN